MKRPGKKLLIPWIASSALAAACVAVVLLFVAGALTLSESAKNALGAIAALSLVVFGCMSSKYAGVLKGAKEED